MSRGRFCHTLDVLTDGSEHTGSGALFLSVWKIPLSVRTANAGPADDSDSSCSSGSSESEGDSDSDDGREDSDAVSDSIENESEENENNEKDHVPPNASHDPHPWLTGSDVVDNDNHNHNHNDGTRIIPVPVARYALSGVGDATARLCADQRFKLAPTRACFVPALGTDAATADGLSALLLALFGAGSPSLHVVVPAVFDRCGNDDSNSYGRRSGGGGDNDGGGGGGRGSGSSSGGAFVEELATITLGSHKRFDIRTCEVRPPRDDSVTWWKVYQDEYLLVHASTCKGLSSTLSLSRAESSIVYLYSFPSRQGQSGTPRETWCTLGLLPPGCANVAGDFERLVRGDLPMIRDGLPMTCIDYVIVLDPKLLPAPRSVSLAQTTFSDNNDDDEDDDDDDGESAADNDNGTLSRLAKRNRVLATLPRRHNGPLGDESAILDEGILMRSQQLHRQLHRCMPKAFVEPKTTQASDTASGEATGTDHWIKLRSGTSLFLEPIGNDSPQSQAAAAVPSAWDRRKAIIRNKELKEEWTRESVESLESFLGERLPVTDENQINLDGETETSKTDCLKTDENEIELEDTTEVGKPDLTADENEIDLEDDDDIEKPDLTANENEIGFDFDNNNSNSNDNDKNKEKPDLMGDENEIDLDDDNSNNDDDDDDDKKEKPDLMGDENEIDLDDDNSNNDDDEDDDKKAKTDLMADENEIDLEDDNESDLGNDNEIEDETAKNSKRIDPGDQNDASEQKDSGNGHLPSRIKTTDKNPGLRDRQCAASGGPGPRLLVLGTGCATPSAYRGASGYALVLPSPDEPEPRRGMRMPRHQRYCFEEQQQSGDQEDPSSCNTTNTECNDQIYILDCGEGVSTMLSRNCGRVKDWATRVRGIWISHAHLDHYGGLPTLLRILWRQRQRQQRWEHEQQHQHQFHSRGGGTANGDSRYRPKRQKMSPLPAPVPVPWVVAPAKVLRYLDLVLDCRYGHRRNGSSTAFRTSSNNTACFEPRLHHDPRIPSGPWFRFENVKVYHNCCPAFGLLIGWDGTTTETRTGGTRTTQPQPQPQHRRIQSRSRSLLCYSGDTRPSTGLVRACKRALQSHHPTPDLFLIHEATYRNTESSMAATKKHSTLAEAREVAVDTGCSRVLLSHFSQRYDTAVSKLSGNKNKNKTKNKNNGDDATEHPNGDRAGRNNPARNCSEPSATDFSTSPEPKMGLAVDGLWIPLIPLDSKSA